MANASVKRSQGQRLKPDNDDDRTDEDDFDELVLRPNYWPRRRRSKKNPTDLEIWKAELWRKVRAENGGKKPKLPKRKVLSGLLAREPLDGTILEMLALVEILEEFNPSPSPTFATLFDLEMAEFPFELEW